LLRYIIRRILLLIPVLIVVSFLVFLLMELAPGSALDIIASTMQGATMEDIAALEIQLGLDKPLIVRYGIYMLNLVQGNLGVSDLSGMSVWKTYIGRLPYTLALAFGGVIIGAAVAIPLGIRTANRAGKLGDNITTTFTAIGMSMPSFWLGILLIILFSNYLGVLPAGDARDGFKSFILPCICSGLTLMATCTRQTRSSMLEVLNADFLRTARAKGVPEKAVIRTHALGNAWIPIMTNIGTTLGISLAGSAVIESAFTWPGVGRMVVEAVQARDVKMATGAVIMTSIMYVVINLIVDLAYGLVDPRIFSQFAKKKGKVRTPSSQMHAAHPTAQTAPADEPVLAAVEAPVEKKVIASSPPASHSYEGALDYVTRENKEIVLADLEEDTAEIMAKYRKRSRMGEIFHHISQNKGAMAGLIIIVALFLTLIISFFAISYSDVTDSDIENRFSPPGWGSIFGYDNMGRNQFERVIYGTRYSLLIGFCGAAISAFVGIPLGSIAGYFGKTTEDVIMRASDVLASMPGLLLGMVIVTVLGRSIPNVIIAVGVPGIHIFVRITRASILTIKDKEFVEATRAIGVSQFRTLFSHVLPNGLAPIIVTFTTILGVQILVGASLSFLGFGVPAPHPEWGSLIASGRTYMRNAPWLTTYPGIFIMITVLAINLLGDGLRDALDPKLKK